MKVENTYQVDSSYWIDHLKVLPTLKLKVDFVTPHISEDSSGAVSQG